MKNLTACLVFFSLGLGLALTSEIQAQNKSDQQSQKPSQHFLECTSIQQEVVKIYASVWNEDKKTYLLDLKPNEFQITEDKETHEIKCFSHSDEPLTVGILLDISGSVRSLNSSQTSEIPDAVEGITSFINKSNPENQYFLIAFASKAEMLLDVTKDKKQLGVVLSEALKLKPQGNTSVYDAISVALKKMSSINEGGKVILVISDGEDNSSTKNDFDGIKKQIRGAGVLIYLINLVQDGDDDFWLWPKSGFVFDTLTKNSGGYAWFPKKTEEVNSAFERLAYKLRNQYTLGFVPKKAEKKKWRKLKVKVERSKKEGKISVIAPDGYFY